MFNIFKKPKFPTTLFVSVAIIALISLPILIIAFYFAFAGITKLNLTSEKYFFKNQQEIEDPFITKVPTLKDIINGPIINNIDPIYGSPEANLSIVIYSDFWCEYCEKQEKIIKKIIDEFSGKIKMIRKDFPEKNYNSTSFKTAIGGRCAHKFGKFNEYATIAYKKEVVDPQKIGIKKTDYEACLTDPNIIKLVSNNIREAEALDIIGVPFIFINNEEIMGEISYEDLKRIVETKLVNKK